MRMIWTGCAAILVGGSLIAGGCSSGGAAAQGAAKPGEPIILQPGPEPPKGAIPSSQGPSHSGSFTLEQQKLEAERARMNAQRPGGNAVAKTSSDSEANAPAATTDGPSQATPPQP